MVEFTDGSTLAQASPPDMRLTIALALGWPDRVPGAAAAVDWTPGAGLDVRAARRQRRFPQSRWRAGPARQADCAPAVYNAANEVLVEAFHDGAIGFLQIVDGVDAVLGEWLSEHHAEFAEPGTVEDVERADAWARSRAEDRIGAAGSAGD